MRRLSETTRIFRESICQHVPPLARCHTWNALSRLARKLPAKTIRKLPAARVFAPLKVWGEVLRLPCTGEVLVYLPPDLEDLPQRCVNYIVAHEFAHVALGHHGPEFEYSWAPSAQYHDEKPEEQAADALVVEWGYLASDNPVHIDRATREREKEEEDARLRREVEEQDRLVEKQLQRFRAVKVER